jgi:hypothetical protein
VEAGRGLVGTINEGSTIANAYYTCNLVPVELVARSGYSPRWRREALSIHPMTCPYVTRLVAAADVLLSDPSAEDRLLVPGGCDAMRRMGDLLAATYPERVLVLPMPRSSGAGAVRTLAADLARMEKWLAERSPDVTSGASSSGYTSSGEPSAVSEPPAVDYPSAPRPGAVFVIAGPLSDNSLLRLIEQLGAGIAGLDSCTSPDRWRPLATAGLQTTAVEGDDYVALATELLAVGMCPRRSTADRREHLTRRLDETRPASVVYARQSFCDPGAYDALLVSQLAQERGLPYLEIEVGFPFEASGPLRTRVEAFLEAQLLDDDLLDYDLLDDDLLDEED